MTTLALILAAALPVEPVLWLHPKGRVLVAGKPGPSRLTKGAEMVQTPFGRGLDLSGEKGGLLIRDLDPLALTGSFTVATWIYLRDYGRPGSGAQILFRGDDRNGNDPYSLVVHNNGTVNLEMGSLDGTGTGLSARIPLRQWVRVTASYSADNHSTRIWLGDQLAATGRSDFNPFEELDAKFAPGLGIGNVQNDKGPHNQPLNAVLADLRLYPAALEPVEAGFPAKRA